MGGFLSLLVDLSTIAVDLSAATGVALESILTGEALAALEAEVSALMTIEGISGIEALAQLGFTAEQFSNFSLISSIVNQALTYGAIFQTVSGLSALISAGIRLGLEERSTVDMNLRSFLSYGYSREIVTQFASGFALDPLCWSQSLLHAIGQGLHRTTRRLNLPVTGNLAMLAEEGRWHLISSRIESFNADSGQQISLYSAPGGAHQRVCPDWLQPLILGLYGQDTLNQQSRNGSKKKKAM